MRELQSQGARRAWLIRVIVIVAAAAAALLVTVAVDRIAGFVVTNPTSTGGLIFHPGSTATYHTTEFNFTAATNSLGFRDHEFAQARTSACRVVAIGDSFTFGWGVALDESWPKALETDLRQTGLGVDVANLGFPGGSPIDYANIAARAVPTLKPDLVVVGVLQGDDLSQLSAAAASTGKGGRRHEVREVLNRIEATLYPHLSLLVGLAGGSLYHGPSALSVNTTWKEQAQAMLGKFSPGERARYERMDPAIRRAFESGDLNPALVQSAARRPQYFMETFDLDRPETRALVEEMSRQLTRIRRVAESAGADVLVVSVPFGLYVSQAMFNTWRTRYGFGLDRRMLTSDNADDAIRMAAEKARLPTEVATPAFRGRDAAPFYFELDGHLNALGHSFYAEQLAPAVGATLRARPRRCGI
jgi:lysophospholipase L1-like esterase